MTEAVRIKPDVEVAMRHTTKIQLTRVSCFAVHAHAAPTLPGGTLHYHVEPASMDWRMSEQGIHVLVPLELSVEYENPQGAPRLPLGTISVSMGLDYRFRDAENVIPAAEIPHVLGVNAYMHSWPYFRADVQQLTSKLGLPALTLPVVLSGQVPDKVLIAAQPQAVETSSKRISKKARTGAVRKLRGT